MIVYFRLKVTESLNRTLMVGGQPSFFQSDGSFTCVQFPVHNYSSGTRNSPKSCAGKVSFETGKTICKYTSSYTAARLFSSRLVSSFIKHGHAVVSQVGPHFWTKDDFPKLKLDRSQPTVELSGNPDAKCLCKIFRRVGTLILLLEGGVEWYCNGPHHTRNSGKEKHNERVIGND